MATFRQDDQLTIKYTERP